MRSSEKQQNRHETLIPELSHNYNFPADYWLKAMLLPCIIHRANFLLLAEELRLKLIADGIDEGRGQQVYKLDIDYGNYDTREKIIEQELNESDSYYNRLSQNEFIALYEEQMKDKKKSLSNVFNSGQNMMALPVDLERDWLNVTTVDIENYASFVSRNKNETGNGIPAIPHEKKLKLMSLEDSESRKNIKLLNLNGKNCSVQQKDLIKVLTTSNSGKSLNLLQSL